MKMLRTPAVNRLTIVLSFKSAIGNMRASTFIRITAAVGLILLTAALTIAHPPTGIVVDRQGRIYFSDLEAIWKLEPDGRIALFRDGVGGRHVHELFMDGDGNVYGSDISYDSRTQKYVGSVWKMSPSGELTWLQEPSDNAGPGLSNWLDRSGNMYSIDQNNHTKTRTVLQRRSPNGTVTTLAGGAYGYADGRGARAQFSSVGGMTFGPDGSLYLTDGNSVRKVMMDGTVTTVARNLNFPVAEDRQTKDTTSRLAGLAVGTDGSVYVADGGRRRLLRIRPDGTTDVVYRAEPPFFPNGVFAAQDGAIYLLEFGLTEPNINSGPRIRKITPDGKNTILVILNDPADRPASKSTAGTSGLSRTRSFVFAVPRFKMVLIITFVFAGTVIVLAWWRCRGTERA